MRKPERLLAALVIAFLVGHLVRLAWFGVRTGLDTVNYVDGALRLVGGRSLTDMQAVHVAYVALIAACRSIGLGTGGVVLLQIGVAGIAVAAVYELGVALSGPMAGLVAAILFACDVETGRWHTYVLTDSLFLSLVPIAVWTAHRASMSRFRDARSMLTAGLVLGGLTLMRFEGWLAPPFVAAQWTLGGGHRWRRTAVAAASVGLAAALLISMPRVRKNIEAAFPAQSLANGQTLWGSDRWTLTMPAASDETSNRYDTPSGLRYAAAHPVMTSALMLARLAVHFGHVRPFYSWPHNALIVAWLLPVYAFALRGWRIGNPGTLRRWMLGAVVVHTGFVAMTHADWDGRFLAYDLSLIHVFTACGIAAIRRLDTAAVPVEDGRACLPC